MLVIRKLTKSFNSRILFQDADMQGGRFPENPKGFGDALLDLV